MPCAVCGNLTSHFLFKDKHLGVPVCSSDCELEYFESLSTESVEQTRVAEYLDRKIGTVSVRNRIFWGVSGLAALLLLLGIVVPNVHVFLAGTVLAVIGPVGTIHFEDKMRKLTVQRKRVKI